MHADVPGDAGRLSPAALSFHILSQGPIHQVASAAVQIVLPSTIYLVVGQSYNLDLTNIITEFDESYEIAVATGDDPQAEKMRTWRFKPSRAESFPLSISVMDENGSVLASKSQTVVAIDGRTVDNLRHLSIGDSITRAGGYSDFAVRCILGGKTVGTRTYDGGLVSTEGRGGWTLKRYTESVGVAEGGDSPFLFPFGVQANQFRGNTSFWKDVTVGDPAGYAYDGFQVMARDWTTNGPFRFDGNGYPDPASAGEVVVDPTLRPGQQWQKYDGSTWSPMQPQPKAGLSFKKYIERYGAAFNSGPPTTVSIMLGTVDFLTSPTESLWDDFRSRLDTMIAAIRAWDPQVPIVVVGPPNGGPSVMWNGREIGQFEFNRRMVEYTRRLYAVYDTEAARKNRVYAMSFLGVVPDVDMADYVHPKVPEGHAKMAPWLAGVLNYLASSGAV